MKVRVEIHGRATGTLPADARSRKGDCEVLSVGHELRDAQSRAWETQKMTVPPLSSPMPRKCTHLKLFLQHRLTALP